MERCDGFHPIGGTERLPGILAAWRQPLGKVCVGCGMFKTPAPLNTEAENTMIRTQDEDNIALYIVVVW